MMLHVDAPLAPHDLWGAWSWEAGVVVPLVAAAALYARGVVIEWQRASHRRSRVQFAAACFAVGWVVLVAALVSPLHALGGTLFSAHMAQHELLMTVAAPLLVLARPLVPFTWALPMRARRAIGLAVTRGTVKDLWLVLSQPAIATAVHGAAIWVWHAPSLYNPTLSSEWVHAAQHATFLGTALLFWWALIHGRTRRAGHGVAVIYVFFTAVHTTILGALLATSASPWYSAYSAAGTHAWGLTPLEDQQLGGLIMWIPATIAYLVAALALFASWLREAEVRVVTRENAARAAIVLFLFVVAGCGNNDARAAGLIVGGDAERGAKAIRKYGCGSCHSIPRIREAQGKVGPPLTGIAGRSYIAGVLSNTPEHLTEWIQNPPKVDSKTAMPNMGVTERDARDIATYLYSLK